MRGIAIGLGFAILLPLLVYYGVASISPPPESKDYLQDRLIAPPPPGQSEAKIADLEAERQAAEQRLDAASKAFAAKVAWISVPVGIGAVLLGAFVFADGLGGGIILGGLATIGLGLAGSWDQLNYGIRFLSLLGAALILALAAWRQWAKRRRSASTRQRISH